MQQGPGAAADGSGEVTVEEAVAYALRLHREGRVEAAAELYQRILAKVPDHLDALHFLGVAKFQTGDPEGALALIGRVVAARPDLASAHNNLGNVLKRLGRLGEAEAAYRRVIELAPQDADAHNNLGALQRERGDLGAAEKSLRHALELAPRHGGACHNLGNVLAESDRLEEAADMFTRAVALQPYDGENYRQLGAALYSVGREEDAVRIYQKWLDVEPESVRAKYMLAAARGDSVPERAPDGFVAEVFDRFASSFDRVLDGLKYQAPTLLVDLVGRSIAERREGLDVLDAGCGTGLCGPLIRPLARRLVGVDLSGEMVERAKSRQVYDDLVVEELTTYLGKHPASQDLIIAADTLCYFGDLVAVVSAAASSLRPGGYLAFTVERSAESEAPSGYRIHAHGRYSHTEAYVRARLGAVGLDPVAVEEGVLRLERDEPVRGLLVVGLKPRHT